MQKLNARLRDHGDDGCPVARLFGITQSAVTRAAGQGETLANDQRYGLISSEKWIILYPSTTSHVRYFCPSRFHSSSLTTNDTDKAGGRAIVFQMI